MFGRHRETIVLAALVLLASACTGGEEAPQGGGGGTAVEGETIEVAATWTGAEQDRFQMVLDGFAEQSGADVRFLSAGDDIAAYVGPRIECVDRGALINLPVRTRIRIPGSLGPTRRPRTGHG